MSRYQRVLGLAMAGLVSCGASQDAQEPQDSLMLVRLGPQEGGRPILVVNKRPERGASLDREQLTAALRRVVDKRSGARFEVVPAKLEWHTYSVITLETGQKGFRVSGILPCPEPVDVRPVVEIPLGGTTVPKAGPQLDAWIGTLLGRAAERCRGARGEKYAPAYAPSAGSGAPAVGAVAKVPRVLRAARPSDAVAAGEVDSITVSPRPLVLRVGEVLPPDSLKVTGWLKGKATPLEWMTGAMRDPTIARPVPGGYEGVRVGEVVVPVRQALFGATPPRMGRAEGALLIRVVP